MKRTITTNYNKNMNKPTPKVSIVIASYNGYKYLEEQLMSLINQTYRNLEIIINDDCSIDGTYSLLQQWKLKYPELIHISQNTKNYGWIKNFEIAFSKATGDIIAYCDQDDIWNNKKIEKCVEVLTNNKKIVLVYHNGHNFGTKNDVDEETHQHKSSYYFAPFEGNDPMGLIWQCYIIGHRMVFRKELLNYIIPSNDMPYDWYISVAAAAKGEIFHLHEDLVAFRQHDKPYDEYDFTISREKRVLYFKSLLNLKKLFSEKDYNFIMKVVKALESKSGFNWTLFWLAFSNRNRLLKFLRGKNSVFLYLFKIRLVRAWAKNW